MNKERMSELLALVVELIRAEGSWQEKRTALLQEASSDEETALEELTSWFLDENE